MARETHSTFRAVELVPYYVATTLERLRAQEEASKQPTVPVVAIAFFSAIVSLGVYGKAPLATLILAASVYLLVLILGVPAGNWLVKRFGAWRSRHKPIGLSAADKDAERYAEAFDAVGVNQLLLCDGLLALATADTPGVRDDEKAFFAGEAAHCFSQAARTIAQLAIDQDVLKKAVVLEPPPADDQRPVVRAIEEPRLRWAVQFAEAQVEQLESKPAFDGKDAVVRRMRQTERSLLLPALRVLNEIPRSVTANLA